MKKSIKDYSIKDKKIIIRVDFNVPIKDGKITDDNRIRESLETIKYAVNKGAKTILLSHLGRIKTEEDKKGKTLKPIAHRLSELLNKKIIFIDETRGKKLEDAIFDLQEGEVLLVENTRFEDINGKKESNNDSSLGKYWASLGDIYINDAFGTAHRAHASNVGIASLIPNGIGFLLEKEFTLMEEILENPQRPFTVILGGSKVSDKIGVIKNIIKKADFLLIAGGMAYTFLKAQNIPVGKSLVDESSIKFCKDMIEEYPNKIILPIDTVNALEIKENTPVFVRDACDTKGNEIGLDIGPKTVDKFKKYLEKSQMIFWNGPAGMFEIELFSKGTKSLCDIVSHCKNTIIGGGDTASAIIKMGYQSKMTHISTGGGASLEFLEGKTLPGIDVIEDI